MGKNAAGRDQKSTHRLGGEAAGLTRFTRPKQPFFAVQEAGLAMSDSAYSWDFFIIHSSADARQAEELYKLLSPPYRVFLDQKAIELSADWMRTLDAALRSSRVFVVLVSEHLDAAHFARDEINTAINLYRADEQGRKIVSVLLGPRNKIALSYGLGILQGAELNTDGGMAAVAARLRQLMDGPTAGGAPAAAPAKSSQPAPPAHELHCYPRAYDIPRERVPTWTLAPAIADRIHYADALHVVAQANAFRLAADPDDPSVTYVRTTAIPAPDPSPGGQFWRAVLDQARLHGPRMLAALLLTVDASHFDRQAKKDRQALLDYLRSLPQESFPNEARTP